MEVHEEKNVVIAKSSSHLYLLFYLVRYHVVSWTYFLFLFSNWKTDDDDKKCLSVKIEIFGSKKSFTTENNTECTEENELIDTSNGLKMDK